MRFPIFNLPSLALEKVMKLMNPYEQVIMCTISKKSYKAFTFLLFRHRTFELNVDLAENLDITLCEMGCKNYFLKLHFRLVEEGYYISQRKIIFSHPARIVTYFMQSDYMEVYSTNISRSIHHFIGCLGDLFDVPLISFDVLNGSCLGHFPCFLGIKTKFGKIKVTSKEASSTVSPSSLTNILNKCYNVSEIFLDMYLDQFPAPQDLFNVKCNHFKFVGIKLNENLIQFLLSSCHKVSIIGTHFMDYKLIPALRKWSQRTFSQLKHLTVETKFGNICLMSMMFEKAEPAPDMRWVEEVTFNDRVSKFPKNACLSIRQHNGMNSVLYHRDEKLEWRIDIDVKVYF